ncbi:DUF202 domain-containing protein [Ornithinibacillus sp. L9]|uniref:DUF202 domain-containing protein n=2 Tax=Ornithinibacillus caprae TaxID=2678566 RepID=A0A6N8FGH2_9BACI|nr:DUF202 domain-containing protein [Ornithinibacillus caprae]MUK88573.1 DUF202 domain-containing protein [Ornithinibacillus caprae]
MNNSDEKKKLTQKLESKYIQQHLANERTFLAWIRTAIAIMGVGFLVTNLHFTSENTTISNGNSLVILIGYSSVVLGVMTIILAVIGYIKKLHSINNQTFRTAKVSLLLIGIFMIIVAIMFGVYIALL